MIRVDYSKKSQLLILELLPLAYSLRPSFLYFLKIHFARFTPFYRQIIINFAMFLVVLLLCYCQDCFLQQVSIWLSPLQFKNLSLQQQFWGCRFYLHRLFWGTFTQLTISIPRLTSTFSLNATQLCQGASSGLTLELYIMGQYQP